MKQITHEDIEKAATIWFQGRVEGGLKQHFTDGAKWVRDQMQSNPSVSVEKEEKELYSIEPLEWVVMDDGSELAITPVGEYHAYSDEWRFNGYRFGDSKSISESKNKAWQNFHSAIKQCLKREV